MLARQITSEERYERQAELCLLVDDRRGAKGLPLVAARFALLRHGLSASPKHCPASTV